MKLPTGIEQDWLEFRDKVLDPNASAEALLKLQAIYYSGALAVLNIQAKLAGSVDRGAFMMGIAEVGEELQRFFRIMPTDEEGEPKS